MRCLLSTCQLRSLTGRITSRHLPKGFEASCSPHQQPLYLSTTTTYRMPPKKKVSTTVGGTKRKLPPSPSNGDFKKVKTAPNGGTSSASSSAADLRQPHPRAQEAEDNGIVLRKYYPHEMSNARALAYNSDTIPRPVKELEHALSSTASERADIAVRGAVVHWFKCDLRVKDNKGLYLAGLKAKEKGVPLVGLYLISPQDFEAHLTSPVRVDFILRTLAVLKEDLGKLGIPLYVETVDKRRNIPGRIVELLEEWRASHLYANAEYEVDELRRETRMVHDFLEKGIAVEVCPDTCVVSPGELSSGTGRQYAVYSPWFKSWVAYIHKNPDMLDLFEAPPENPSNSREIFKHIFEMEIPDAPENKKLTDAEKLRFHSMWPAGEGEAHRRLTKFVEGKIIKYGDRRNFPSDPATSSLSVHFASGTLSARTAIRVARDKNNTKLLNGGNQGIQTWISEVAWRDFYKHVLANWPYVCMNKPFKPEYTDIEWEYNTAQFEAWCTGKTGYPIVDAAMRQLNHTGWMHNRCRMIVASFLAKDLLIDWRMGEQYFMLHLIDGDFASNNGGWGFSASTGVDPQPYFRIFNPLLQSEKFDADGEYIRKWVPELRGVVGKAIHEPYDRGEGKALEKKGYPRKIVDHKESRERTLARYKEGLGRSTA